MDAFANLITLVGASRPIEAPGLNAKEHPWTIAGGLLLFYLLWTWRVGVKSVDAPVVGHRSIFEPAWLVRLRFVRCSRGMISQGYEQFKDSLFKIRRIGTDVVVLSPRYAEEVRSLSKDKERSVQPFINDFCGQLVKGMVFLESDLQNRIVQQKLTPNLAALTSVLKDELDYAIDKEMPLCSGQWTTCDITSRFARVIARISARVFLGPEECRNEKWLATTAEYTENLFITGMILRMFPRFIRPLVAPLVPTYRGLRRNVVDARAIVGSVLDKRLKQAQQGSLAPKSNDILQWMHDAAVGKERELANLSQRILILSLSSIHTTALTMSQALYDLCAHPEYLEPLRAEIIAVLRRDGDWQKTTLTRLVKLDSFIKESQRISPVFLFTFNRIFHESMTLSNGVHLPAGTRVAVAAHSMLNDARHVPGPNSPADFDGFRYSRLREDTSQPANAGKHLLAMTDANNMAFGFGKYACPGRFYASNEMKLVLAHMILRYDFKFMPGCGRPKNFTVDTDMYPDRSARLLVRERSEIEPDIRALIV